MNSRERRRYRRSGVTNSAPPSNKRSKPARPQRGRLARYVSIGKALWAVVVVASTLLSYAVLKPSVVIDPYVSQDPSTPFAEQFSVQNTSIYEIHDIRPSCGIIKVITDDGNSVSDSRVENILDFSSRLAPGAKSNATCPLDVAITLPSRRYKQIDIGIRVDYKIPLGITRCKVDQFSGIPAPNRTFIWTHRGSADCNS